MDRLNGMQADLWTIIWRMKVPNKVRNFAWRVCQEALPVMSALFRRHITADGICDRCNSDDETIWHVLVQCQESSMAWASSPLLPRARGFQFVNMTDYIDDLYQSLGMLAVQDFFVFSWVAWSVRDKTLFEADFNNPKLLRD